MSRSMVSCAVALAGVFLLSGCAQTVHDARSVIDSGGASAQAQNQRRQAQMPHCDRPHGTAAVYEPQKDWWTPLGLPSPEAVIKVYVMKSGCFKLVDRGSGFDVAQRERELASGGDLRAGSNIGKGQVKAADYVLVPDIVSKNANSSGSALTALAGGLIGGTAGALISKINITGKTADVVLTLTDVRTSEQKAMAEGHGEHVDWSIGGGALVAGNSGFGGAGLGSYQNTDVGQVVMLAYLDAYEKMIGTLGYQLPASASAASPAQAATVVKSCNLRSDASTKSKVVRTLTAGMMVYPTGTKSGSWWEVTDEMGNKGWVSATMLELAK